MPTFKTKDGLYGFTHRWVDRNGKQHRIKRESREWGAREAKRQLEKFISDIVIDDQASAEKIPYKALYDSYLKFKKLTIKARSILELEGKHSKHILPYWGDTLLGNITHAKIKIWQEELLAKRTDKGSLYSNEMLEIVQRDFKAVLSYGVREGYMSHNPFRAKKVKRSNMPKPKFDFWTIDEYNQFISVVDSDFYKLMFQLLFFTGLRKGELLALQLSDYKDGWIDISKTWDYRTHQITTPKTSNSYRLILLDNCTSRMLSDYIDLLKQYYGCSDSTFIFGFDKPKSNTAIEFSKNKYCQLAKVKQIRIHDFRHSHVAMLIHQGFNAFEIAERLGHTVTMVNEIYGHLYPDSQSRMIDKINSMTRS